MSRFVRTAVAAAALSVAAATPAHAFSFHVVVRNTCKLVSATDLTSAAGWQVGTLAAVVPEAQPHTLDCAVYVNGVLQAYVPGITVATGAESVAVVAGPVTFPATAADSITVCAIFDGTVTANDCTTAGGGSQPNDPECPLLLSVDSRLGTPLADVWQDCGPYAPII
jgi:hypothetical protein